MSQFAFLEIEFADIYSLAKQAEDIARTDPRGACFYARLALETMVNWIYRHDASVRDPFETTLSARIHEPTFQTLAGRALITKARIVKDLGNKAAHQAKKIPFNHAATSLRELFHFSYWLVRTYAKGKKPDSAVSFLVDFLPENATIPIRTLAQLKATARQYEEQVRAREAAEAERRASETELQRLEAEIAALQAEVAKAKAENAKVPDGHDYDEATTRDAFIDLLLAESGWKFTRPGVDTEYPVKGMPNATGAGYVDYVLWGDDRKPLGLVEAKRTKRSPDEGKHQAKLYADCLEAEFGQRPVIFYSNGYEHHLWDDKRYAPREVSGFLTKDELELAIRRRDVLRPLREEDINTGIAGRYYQVRAIRRISESFERDNARRALLVMATGSGKTRTVIALCDLLMRANWARRVLFLADRVALVNQAVNAFKTHLPNASPVNLTSDKDATGRIYVSTYPTMMRLIDDAQDGRRRFGPGHFDLIVVDEAHRSVYRKYGAIFSYFDSLLIGLTATPKDEIDRDTFRLFGLQTGIPTDAYDLEEAVNDKFLVPAKAVSVPIKFQRDGITYDDLTDEEKEAWDATEWGEDGSVPKRVEAASVNKWLFNKDTVDKVLEHLMVNGLKVDGGDRLGKTIIFAKNRDHAKFIVSRFDENYPHYAGSFAQTIDYKTDYAQSLIDDFSQAEKAPHIAVSVDMLDTGIDVPEVVNLVFFKIVRSKTKFWQMLGRGTRLCPDLLGPGKDKEYFKVFDFCQNLEFFKQNPETAEGGGVPSLSHRLFAARVELIGLIDEVKPDQGGRESNGLPASTGTEISVYEAHRKLRDQLTQRLVEEVAGMPLDNFIVRPMRRYVEKFSTPESWTVLRQGDRMQLTEHVAGLPTSFKDDDLAAKQFDILILRTQMSILQSATTFGGFRKKIIEIAELLEELSNVPAVRNELELIQELQTDQFWEGLLAPTLETVRRRLRSLVNLIEIRKRKIVITDFEDEIGTAVEVDIRKASPGTDMGRFRQKARLFLKAFEDHIAVLKLKRNEPLTPTDLTELEKIFLDAGTETGELDLVKAEGGLGLFVRSIVGLDRGAAKQAFDSFVSSRELRSEQIEFLNLVIDYLTERGAMDPRLLYESPFTDLDPLGVGGLFDEMEVAEVISILRDVQNRAAA